MAAGACSLMVDTNTTQCRSDSDCARFGAVCNQEQRVCVNANGPGSADGGRADPPSDTMAAPTCTGPGGCYACTPTSEEQIVSQCTDSTCVPFDNARVTLLAPDGHLRPLP
jgi:hypothetical protein